MLNSADTSVAAACRRPLTPADLCCLANRPWPGLAAGCAAMPRVGFADDADGATEFVRPRLPRSVCCERDARQASSEGEADTIGEAELRPVPVERRRQAGVEAAERADRDPKVFVVRRPHPRPLRSPEPPSGVSPRS